MVDKKLLLFMLILVSLRNVVGDLVCMIQVDRSSRFIRISLPEMAFASPCCLSRFLRGRKPILGADRPSDEAHQKGGRPLNCEGFRHASGVRFVRAIRGLDT